MATEVFPTSPSATSQLLVFRALERAVAGLDVARLRDRRVSIEVVSQLHDDRFAATYLETWFRTHGVKVENQPGDLRLQVYFLTLGTDKGQSFIGIPPFQVPVLSIPVPEIALFKWIRNRGRADVRVYAFDPKTDALVDLLPETSGRSKFDDYTILIVVGFTVTDVNDPILMTPRAPEP
ncbi:MAG TPA: hypothetical protein VJU81_26035 [Methylomirabilota bacterium]|nr:hypothetical protein [Methylomirabilota bacterium]